jgi:hypothetical protein
LVRLIRSDSCDAPNHFFDKSAPSALDAATNDRKEVWMTDIDWNAPAKLIERDDAGSEMFYEFKHVNDGPLSALVAQVAALDAMTSARMVIDAGAIGMFAVGQILELSQRADFPA